MSLRVWISVCVLLTLKFTLFFIIHNINFYIHTEIILMYSLLVYCGFPFKALLFFCQFMLNKHRDFKLRIKKFVAAFLVSLSLLFASETFTLLSLLFDKNFYRLNWLKFKNFSVCVFFFGLPRVCYYFGYNISRQEQVSIFMHE